MTENRIDPANAQSRETAAKLGYRQLTEQEQALVKRSRDLGDELRKLIDETRATPADPHFLAMAQAELQTGLMHFVRAVSKPDFF